MSPTTVPAESYPANPWRGRQRCPECALATWTMPYDLIGPPWDEAGPWRCVACHVDFEVVTADVLCPSCDLGLSLACACPPIAIDLPPVAATITGVS